MPEGREGESARVVAVVGPTAVGKSALAEALALKLGGEIVSADSMQVYRGMDIGTAKPPAEERLVPYHCIDMVDPGIEFSAALFQKAARTAIGDILARGSVPIVVGGTGLYVRAALDDMRFPSGETSSPARERLEALAAAEGPHALHARLAELDPESAAIIHPNNVRRTIRALEMAEEGVSYARQAAGFTRRADVFDTRYIGLALPRPELYRRIDARVDEMIERGLLEEVVGLLAAGLREALTASQAIGYKELVGVLDGRIEMDDAVESIKRSTRRYAKRQLTWFRADPRVAWIDLTDLSSEEALAGAERLLESNEAPPYPFAYGV